MSDWNNFTSTDSLSSGIQQVPSGNYGAVMKLFKKTRLGSFDIGHAVKYTGTNVHTPGVNYVVDPPGTEMQRATTGMGEFVMDPMQNLNQKITVDTHTKVSRQKDQDTLPTKSVRDRGVAAYKKANGKGNK